MFSKRIVSSAKFLKMPTSSQCLYFHLGVNADDDGVVEAYTVMNSTGASENDVKILVDKGFVQVLNDDMVAYITDWNENNKIRADRKIDSIYKDLLMQVLPDVQLLNARKRTDNDLRSSMYKDSTLPDKFMGVIRGFFYGERCPICSTVMKDGNTKPSVQHNTPISKGGRHEIDNISVICLSCNMSLKNKETGTLNNDLVKEFWGNYLKTQNEDRQRTDKGQIKDSIGKDRTGQGSLGQDRVVEDREGQETPDPFPSFYGKFHNVLLSDDELEGLKNDFPDDYDKRIEKLSAYMHSTGKRYENHFATIQYWAEQDKEKQKNEKQTTSGQSGSNPFLAMARDKGLI